MTEQQAIKILKEEKSWESDDRKIDAYHMGIEALEKQNELKKYIDECKSCGRGSAVEWLEKYLIR